MSANHLEESVLNFLKSTTQQMPAKTIASFLKLERSAVNRVLYGLLLTGNVMQQKGTPPLWSYKNANFKEEKSSSEPKNVIFIDLGNIHDILPKVEPYADDCLIYAFADRGFNGYGVNPPPKNPAIHVLHEKDDHKNAADITMIWTAAELVMNSRNRNLQSKSQIRFIIFTKDQGFRSLKTILERYPIVKEVLFVQHWEKAREFIE